MHNTVKYFIKYAPIFAAFLLLLVIAFIISLQEKLSIEEADLSCVISETRTVRGESMKGILKNGERVKVLLGYFECNPVERDQVVVLEFKTREGESFVKRVRAKGGDRLEFFDGQAKVNGEILKNSTGESYRFSSQSQQLLSLPLRDGKIQEGYFLVLSEEVGPEAFDSRQYGYVELEHLKGRVLTKNQ